MQKLTLTIEVKVRDYKEVEVIWGKIKINVSL